MKTGDAKRQYEREYYHAHKEQQQAKHRKWYHLHKEENKERKRVTSKRYHTNLKLSVLTYYGGGKAACVVCGEERLPCLSIDHINGGGLQQRRELGRIWGAGFYTWLRKEGYPEGYQTLCMNCQFMKKWREREI